MHSRIIELSKEPDLKQERISEASIPEWFCNTIADYTDANTDRDHDIKWFLSCVGNYVDVAEDGHALRFRVRVQRVPSRCTLKEVTTRSSIRCVS